MGFSFNNEQQNTIAGSPAIETIATQTMSVSLAFASMENRYTLCTDGRYLIYDEYSDEDYTTLDAAKNLKVAESQVNITQEENSQYIPFKIKRYWDGVDLMDMFIQIYYENKEKQGDCATPINVAYDESFITFGWLVSANVTAIAGDVTFELRATGNNSKGDNYNWRTRPNGKLTVLAGLLGTGIIEPSTDWYTSFTRNMNAKIAEAKAYADEAKDSAASINVQLIKDDVTTSVLNDVSAKIKESLIPYYTESQVDALISDINDTINGLNSLENLKVEYEIINGKGVLSFSNGDILLSAVELSEVEPSAAWTASFKASILQEVEDSTNQLFDIIDDIEGKTTALSEDLNSLKTSVDSIDELSKQNETKITATAGTANEAKNTADTVKSEISNVSDSIQELADSLSGLENTVKDISVADPNTYYPEFDEETRTFTFYENDLVQTQFTISGGGGGNVENSKIIIERITASSIVALSEDKCMIEYTYESVDNAGDDTGDGTATWYVGNAVAGHSVAFQGKNSYDITSHLKTGTNKIRLSITDSFGTTNTKTWTITVVEFRIESIFDDALFYAGEVTFRYTPYGDLSKKIHFILDGAEISGATSAATGRQMTQTISPQSHGAHLLEVYMTATINEKEVRSNSIYKDIIWIDSENTSPVIGCSLSNLTGKQYNTITIPYVVYDPENNPAAITLSVNGALQSNLSVGRTKNIWSFRPITAGNQLLTITCGAVTKTIAADIEELGIDISPVTTNLAFDFNPSGRNNGDIDKLWSDDNYTMQVSDNFDWSNGGYQVDEDDDTYFCVKAGTRAVINYPLFADDAKKTGKNFKLIYKSTNVKDYDAQVISCFDNAIGFRAYAQSAILNSEQNDITVPYCEDHYMELEFNILPDAQHLEMVMWVDGIPSRVKLYSASDSFTQNTPESITIGSDDCDVWVYRMKTYTMNLTDDEVLDNFIADAKNADEMISRYMRNDITDANGNLEPDLLAEKCPELRIIKISAPRFTTGKKNEVSDTTIQQIYKNGRAVEDNWTAKGTHKGQGTSSEYYGESGRNLDINCKGGFTFADGTEASKYAMTGNSMAENYFNIKVNIASSENANNACLADDYNTFNPYLRAIRIANSKVRDTMEFHPCVIFVQETDTANSTVFHDGQWHFYACGDFGNSKKNSDAMGMDSENHKEFIVEVMNNTDPQSRFLSDDLSGEAWDGDGSFEFRYSNPDCTDEEIKAGQDAWQRVLSWVVNATPEQFVAEFEDYFVKDSMLFSYLFTERHTMVDNRAKNVFVHTTDLIHWNVSFDYDNDTAMGNDNEGGLTLSYGYEDIDTIGTKSVFNASDSKLWGYIRDYMQNDLAALYLRLESQLVWSADRILAKMENYQAMKPERLWVMDMRRKYFRTYEDNGTTSYLPMMHGDKKHQRRQYQRYQEKYIASKYVGAACTSDVITIRGYTPTNWTGVKPDGTFNIKPYADTYIVNRFGSNITKVRAKREQTYEVKCPIEVMNDTEVYTYNASIMQSIGDIAPFYPGYTDFNQGLKLTELLIGSNVEGYVNTNMVDFDIGRNTLLERLNLQNLTNLKKTISLSGCTNLEELLAEGSGITGVVFPIGGKIRIARLPAVTSLSAANLYQLAELTLENYTKLSTININNCPTIDEQDLLTQAVNLNRLRLTGINWSLQDTALLDQLSSLTGVDENGYNTVTSVLAGKVYVPVMRQQKLAYYHTIWPDLEIVYDTIITQYQVTFKNDDANKTVLDIQYVDKGADAVNPITRENNPITTPTKTSTVSTDYTFAAWDESYTAIFEDKTITATYSESTREYAVKYVSKGLVLQETHAPYGSTVYYQGDMPVYTAEEAAYKYNLFTGWDKSGLVDGDKTVNAVYDTCEYSIGYFNDKELQDLREVELYAMMKMDLESELLSVKDALDFKLGIDYSYGDIEEQEIIASTVRFDGTNHLDTGIKVMSADKSWTLAIDFSFHSNNSSGATLAQCFQSDGSNGFRLWHSTEPRLSWGTDSLKPSSGTSREIVVIRHIAGSNNVTVYNSNMSGNAITTNTLTALRNTTIDSTLVFGCTKADDGIYESYAKGAIHWCKIWYADLGEEQCSDIASWIHESIPMEVAKFRGYYLADTNSKRANITFLASNLLGASKQFSNKSTNDGGWESSTLNTWLNTRLTKAISPLWQMLLKPVKVSSSVGNKSNELVQSGCSFFVPSLYEIDASATSEPYINETNVTIPYLVNDNLRKRSKTASPEVYESYWTRSPNVSFSNYVYTVNETGSSYGFSYPSYESGVLLMFSIGV